MGYLDEEIDPLATQEEQDAQDIQAQDQNLGNNIVTPNVGNPPVVNPNVTSTTTKTYTPSVDPGNPLLNQSLNNPVQAPKGDLEPYAPLLQYMDKIKPQPNVEDEERQKKIARVNAIGQALGLIANGVGAANGATVVPNDNKVGLDAYNRYLNDRQKYKAETDNWQKDYLRTISQATQHKIAQQAKDEAEAKKTNEWYKQKAVEFEQQARMAGINHDANWQKNQETIKNSNDKLKQQEAFQHNENALNRAAANARAKMAHDNKTVKGADYEVRLDDGSLLGLKAVDAVNAYTKAISDPEIQKKYPLMIISSLDAPAVQKGKVSGLLSIPEVRSKYGAGLEQYDQYKGKGSIEAQDLGNPPSDEATIKKLQTQNNGIAADKSLNKAVKKARIFKNLTTAGYPKETAQSIIDAYQL